MAQMCEQFALFISRERNMKMDLRIWEDVAQLKSSIGFIVTCLLLVLVKRRIIPYSKKVLNLYGKILQIGREVAALFKSVVVTSLPFCGKNS